MEPEISISSENEFEEKASYVHEQFPEKLKKLNRGLRFAADLLALFGLLGDNKVHWSKKVVVLAALLYFVFPLDSIPDAAPFIGYLDDMGFVAVVLRYLGKQLKPYYL